MVLTFVAAAAVAGLAILEILDPRSNASADPATEPSGWQDQQVINCGVGNLVRTSLTALDGFIHVQIYAGIKSYCVFWIAAGCIVALTSGERRNNCRKSGATHEI